MTIIAHLRQNTFLKHNAIYFIGSLVTGILNYLYYPVLARLMQPVAFGEVQTLVSVFLQITTFLTVLGLLAVNIIANYDNTAEGNRVVMELERLALFVSVGLLLVTILAGSWLQRYFHFTSSAPFAILILTLIITVPFTFRSAYLRARQLFGLYSYANAGSSAIKLVASALLVALGFGTGGAIFGIALSQVVAFVYVAHYARRHGFTESLRQHSWRRLETRLIKPELKYALLVLACSLTVTLLYSIDIVIVKHYFDAHTAGLYASIATVSRILFFLTASVSQVLMPAVRLKNASRENSRILLKSLILLVATGGFALIVFYLAPRFVVGLLMGSTYLAHAELLPRLSLAIFVVSIVNLLLTYYMALRRYAVGLIALFGALLTLGLMYTSHQSLDLVINGLLQGSITLLVCLLAWMGWINRSVLVAERTR